MAAVSFEGWSVPDDFPSDGCTFVRERLFGVVITPACRLHDFQRRYKIVPRGKADGILRRHWISLGLSPWAAWPLWAFVRLATGVFKRSYALPAKWRAYANQQAPSR